MSFLAKILSRSLKGLRWGVLLSCFKIAVDQQVLNYGKYLCVGVWEWCCTGTPVDLGFSQALQLELLAHDFRDGFGWSWREIVDDIRHLFSFRDVGFILYVTLLTVLFVTASLCCIAPVIVIIKLTKVYIYPVHHE